MNPIEKIMQFPLFSIEQLQGLCSDLWIAGQETTTTTLTWGIAFLINYPEVQAKIHAELDGVVGNPETLVTVAHRPSLPYINAVINVRKLRMVKASFC